MFRVITNIIEDYKLIEIEPNYSRWSSKKPILEYPKMNEQIIPNTVYICLYVYGGKFYIKHFIFYFILWIREPQLFFQMLYEQFQWCDCQKWKIEQTKIENSWIIMFRHFFPINLKHQIEDSLRFAINMSHMSNLMYKKAN